MKHSQTFIFVFFLLVFAVSCGGRKSAMPVIVENTKTIKEVVKDTVFEITADSSYYKAYIDCRDGKPVILKDSIITLPGKRIVVPKVVLKNHYINVDCKETAQKLFHSWKEKYVTEIKPKVVFVPKEVSVEKPLSFWQKIQIWFGRLMMIQLLLAVLFTIVKLKKII